MGSKSQKCQLREGAVVVITGASSGLGRQLALLLCKRKIRLVLAGRDSDRLVQVKYECEQQGNSEVSIFRGDLAVESACKQLVAWTQQTYNRIDCLILNAGVNAHFQFSELGDSSIFQKLMRTNFYANVYLTKYALPLIKRTGGRIVVISSLSGKFGLPLRSAYCASKFALTGFFQSLRTEEMLPILMVYPTSLETPMRSHSLIKGEKESVEKRQDPKACAELIIKGMDQGLEDIYMPWKAKLGVLLQPVFPRLMRWKVKQAARL